MAGKGVEIISLENDTIEGLLDRVNQKDKRLINALPSDAVTFDVLADRDYARFKHYTRHGYPMHKVMLRIGHIRDANEERFLWALLFKRRDTKSGMPQIKFVHRSALDKDLTIIDIHTFLKKSVIFQQEFSFVATQTLALEALIRFYFFKHDYNVPWEVDYKISGGSFVKNLIVAAGDYDVVQDRKRRLNYGLPSFPETDRSRQRQELDISGSESSTLDSDLAEWRLLLDQSQSIREKKNSNWKALTQCEQSAKASESRIASLQKELEKEKRNLQKSGAKAKELRDENERLIKEQEQNGNQKRKLLSSLPREIRAVYELAVQDARQAEEDEDEKPLKKRRRV